MKKRIITFMLLILFLITGCQKKEEDKVENKLKQDLTIIETNKDGTIKKGTLEGYTFIETEETTDRVKIEMEDGRVILAVLSNKDTPITIANFKKLVENHFYDGIIFHRVIKDFMIQTGDPTGTGLSGSDETIKGEFKANGVENNLSHTKGVLSMARKGGNPETEETMNSASSQFFIVQADSTYLDGNYASFGRVFAGLDAVDNIASVETDSSDKPTTEQKIKTIRFIEISKEEN